MIFQYLCLAGLGFGAFAGMIAVLRPAAIASSLRLQADPDKPGGFAEFRATFGGVFFMIHTTAIVCVAHLPPTASVFAILPIGMAWYGAAFARLASMVLDTQENGQGGINRYWVLLELVVGTMILSIIGQLIQGAG